LYCAFHITSHAWSRSHFFRPISTPKTDIKTEFAAKLQIIKRKMYCSYFKLDLLQLFSLFPLFPVHCPYCSTMEDYYKKNTHELKSVCSKRRLSTAGKKIALVKRPVDHDKQKHPFQATTFNRYNNPDGAKRRQCIEEEYGFKRAALFTVSQTKSSSIRRNWRRQ
jgi:hypothetical protein